MSPKHISVTLQDKLEVVKRLDIGESASELAVWSGEFYEHRLEEIPIKSTKKQWKQHHWRSLTMLCLFGLLKREKQLSGLVALD